jgi:hypothetical protein
LEFDVGEELPQRDIVVNLRWIDGSPASNARVLLRDLKDAIGTVGEEPLTDGNGHAILHGFVGRGYKVDTYPECSDGTRRDASATTPPSVLGSTVNMVLPEPKCDLIPPKPIVFDDD